MHGAIFMLIFMGGGILLLAAIGFIIIGIIKAAKTGGISKTEKQAHAEDTKMIQDIFNSLSRMEERVEALETILIERGKKDQ